MIVYIGDLYPSFGYGKDGRKTLYHADSYRNGEGYHGGILKQREYNDLPIGMGMLGRVTGVGVDNKRSVDPVDMRKERDTPIESHKQYD